MEEFGALVTIIDLITSSISFLLSVGTYVLTALGLYTIAQRRGINKPWLAWIPVVNVWTLGCISDQYRYVVKGEKKSKRKVLIGLNIAQAVCVLVFFVLMIVMIVDVAGMAMDNPSEQEIITAVLGSMGGMLLMFIPMVGISLATTIITYMALYDVYTSCDPKNNVTFLVLSILFSITQPFFIFFSRKKDLGMPPRRPDPMQYMPPQQNNWQNPQQDAYQQPQPDAWQQPQQPQQTYEQNNSGNPEIF
jgi:hypothetical protein